jgi:hypothetical protein
MKIFLNICNMTLKMEKVAREEYFFALKENLDFF